MSEVQDQMANALMRVLAKASWDAYKKAVGGKSINGDPLPEFEALEADPSKSKIVEGWKAAGIAAVTAFSELQK